MSRGVLLANFLLMVAMSVLAGVLVAFPPRPPPVPEPLLAEFDPAGVTSLEVTRSTGVERLEREASGAWTLTWGRAPQMTSWPAGEARVRPALRMLAEARLTPSAADLGADAPSLRIEGGQEAVLGFGMTGAAGRAGVSVSAGGSTRVGLTDDRFHAVFARNGLLAWRDERAMPGVARDPAHVRITAPAGGGGGVELTRVQGRWGLVGGVVDRADAATVQSTIDALARVSVSQFRDDLDPGSSGLVRPRVTMEVRGGRADDAYAWRIEIGDPASADGNQVFVALSGVRGEGESARQFGPVYGVLGLGALSRVFANPDAYVARTSLETPAPDIRRFSIRTPDGARTWRYERTIDGWRVASPGAEASRATTAAESAAIPVVLELLTTAPASTVGLAAPAGLVPVASLSVEGATGLASESVTIGRAPASGAAAGADGAGATVLVVGAGASWRVYGPAPEALAALLPVGG